MFAMFHRGRLQARSDAGDRRERQLVTETEDFLAGRLLELRYAAGQSIPDWAWINRLAHGTIDDLTEVAGEWRHGGLYHSWRRARAYLAGELLDAAPTQASLIELQRELLVPLELQLMHGCAMPLRPRHLVARVLTALNSRTPTPPRRCF